LIANRPQFAAAEELQRMAELLVKYPVLALPTAVASVVMVAILFIGVLAAVAAVVAGHAAAGQVGTGVGVGTGIVIGAGLLMVGLIAVYVGQAMVVAAAPFALEDRPPNLGTALRVTIARLPDLAVAAVVTFLIALIPIALCIVLIGIPLLIALGYLFMYVPAAVVIGNEGGIAAIKTSFRIATTRVNESFICWLGTILALIAGSAANSFAIHIPVVNLIAGFVVGGFTSAYAALVSVRVYLALRDGGAPGIAPAPATSPAPGIGGPPTIVR
jgi:hypothetical protein